MTLQISYADARLAGTSYSLTLKNESAQHYTFYVFQKDPDQASADIFSLAWFASPFAIVPGNQIKFNWTIDYNFVWGATGTLMPGVTFHASGLVDADPAGSNKTNFTIDPGPHLTDPTKGEPSGSLVIKDGPEVPNNAFSVGIGMSGAGTFAVQAGPNLTHAFTPTPTYYIGAGQNVHVGDVLDIVTSNPVAQVKFGHGEYNESYTLKSDNKWQKS